MRNQLMAKGANDTMRGDEEGGSSKLKDDLY